MEQDNANTQTDEQAQTAATAAAAAEAAAAEAAAAKANGKKVKARVLLNCHLGEINDVVSLPADEAKLAEENGQIDTSKAAVAYAAGLTSAD